MENPLFIPLKSEFYEAFKNGSKIDELRKYGSRWNERTCRVGRPVVISKGYGKQNRMIGTISDFCKQKGNTFSNEYRRAIMSVYGTDELDVAMIRITGLEILNGNR
jgi:hypothetical protein